MNKTKFEKKCQELYAYEDKCLEELTEFVKPYNEKLREKGYEIAINPGWHYVTKNGIENHSSDRLQIDSKKTYACNFSVQFQIIGANYDDDDGLGFQLISCQTTYGTSFWLYTLWRFKTYDLKYFYKKIPKVVDEIMQNGLEKTAQKYLKGKNSRG
ncbi:MAG: hypothetical protein FWD58_06045 [Firmicutes bacterium]|nr:hypothetical protein [Bacillota bacterium]